ncbi:MAG: DALR anticodon-binding domain-containing protein [bacterium]
MSLINQDSEIALMKKIDELQGVLDEVVADFAPHALSRYLISVSQLFNTYYNEINVAKSEETYRVARVFLLKKLSFVLNHAMTLLGMHAVERM